MYTIYPADMPPPVVRSPLGLPLGGSGLLPGPLALPCYWPGAYIIQILWFFGCTTTLLNTYTSHRSSNNIIIPHSHNSRSQDPARSWRRKGGVASNRSTSGATPPIPGVCGDPFPFSFS